MTLAEMKRLKTFKVRKTFSGKYHADNHDELRKDIEAELTANGIDLAELTETDYGFNFLNRSVHKPKIKKESIGTITIRSKDYYFTNEAGAKSYGNLPKASDMLANGFRVGTFDGNYIEYEILNDSKEGN